MQVKLQRAAELTGKSRSTIHRAMEKGRVSFTTSEDGERVIDTSELERAFGLLPQGEEVRNAENDTDRHEPELVELRSQLTVERERTRMLTERVDELRVERDAWRTQATGLLGDKRERDTSGRVPFWRRWLETS
jgi:hypothetical protein